MALHCVHMFHIHMGKAVVTTACYALCACACALQCVCVCVCVRVQCFAVIGSSCASMDPHTEPNGLRVPRCCACGRFYADGQFVWCLCYGWQHEWQIYLYCVDCFVELGLHHHFGEFED